MSLNGPDGSVRAILEATGNGAILNLFGDDTKSVAHLGVGTWDLRRGATGSTQVLSVYGEVLGPQLKINDRDGFSSVLGNTSLVTPETGKRETTSAASLILFGSDGKSVWSAPH